MAKEIEKVEVSRLAAGDEETAPVERDVSGFASEGRRAEAAADEHVVAASDLYRILFVALAAGALWFVKTPPAAFFVGIGIGCTLVGGYPIFHEAFANIRQRRMTMELSMTLAIVAALAIREVFTALVITLFVLAAEVLESLVVGRGRRAIRHLIELLPASAAVRRGGTWTEVDIRQLSPGEVVLVRPGGRIPVDGSVEAGNSFVDQATITGESQPVEKSPGADSFCRHHQPIGGARSSRGAGGTRLDVR